MSIDTFSCRNLVSHRKQVPGSYIEIPSCKDEAVALPIQKDVFFWRSYCEKKVSFTVYINIMSYLLVCWVYCELPTPSLPSLIQPPLRLKLDPDPRSKDVVQMTLVHEGGDKYEIK